MSKKFNNWIGEWEVSEVEDMDHMFDGAAEFDQNLSCWDVRDHFMSGEPTEFASRSNLDPSHMPRFGRDPTLHCHFVPELPADSSSFIIKILIKESDMSFTWPVRPGFDIECTISWGDGTSNVIDTVDSLKLNHTYAEPGIKTISVTGTCGAPLFADYYDSANQLIDIVQWGNLIGAIDWSEAFQGCYYLTSIFALDSFGSGVLNTSAMFADCPQFLGNNRMSTWSMSSVRDMSSMFYNCAVFNQDISSWNVTSVEDMSSMFEGASAFNSPLTSWSTDSLVNMSKMFKDAEAFDQPMRHFVTDRVTDMSGMFVNAVVFNQYIGSWDVSNVNTMAFMFNGTNVFNQNLSCWDVSSNPDHVGFYDYNVDMPSKYFPRWGQSPNTNCLDSSIYRPFTIRIVVDQPGDSFTWPTRDQETDALVDWGDGTEIQRISSWNSVYWTHVYEEAGTYEVSVMGYAGAPWFGKFHSYETEDEFNRVFGLDVAATNTTVAGFDWTTGFAGDIGFPDSGMIIDSQAAQEPIGLLDTDNVTYDWTPIFAGIGSYLSGTTQAPEQPSLRMDDVLDGTTQIVDILSWGNLIGAKDWSFALKDCYYLDSLSATDKIQSSIVNMSYMFSNCYGLSSMMTTNWNVESVEDFSFMFSGCDLFNEDLDSWRISSARTLEGMFENCLVFNGNVDNWTTVTVEDMSSMFANCGSFNRDVGSWNTSSVKNMSRMFYNATNFNRDIGHWGVSSATDVSHMLYGVSYFTHDLSCWDVSSDPTHDNFGTIYSEYDYSSALMYPRWGATPVLNCSEAEQFVLEIELTDILDFAWPTRDQLSDFYIDWGDDSPIERVTYDPTTDTRVPISAHRYATASTYTIAVQGTAGALDFQSLANTDISMLAMDPDSTFTWDWFYDTSYGGWIDGLHRVLIESSTRVTSIKSFGNLVGATDWSGAFYNCNNLIRALGVQFAPGVTSLSRMFYGCSKLNQLSYGELDVSSVEDFSEMFYSCTEFNDSGLNYLDISSAKNMSGMFENSQFYSDLSDWANKVSGVTDMSRMFAGSPFNGWIDSWDVSSAADFSSMFENSSFASSLSGWSDKLSSASNMSRMFAGTSFNNWIGSWDVSSVTNFTDMLPTTYNKNLSCWNVQSISIDPWTAWYDQSDMVPSFRPRWGQAPNIGCTSNSVYVARPSITSPVNGAQDVPTNKTITTSAFSSVNGSDSHQSSSWQIATSSTFDTGLVETLNDATNKTSWVRVLTLNTTYYVRVKHVGATGGESLWSEPVSFRVTVENVALDWSKVYLHMNCEGAENGTVFSEDSNNSRTITKTGVNGWTMAAAKYFNNTGLRLNGGTYLTVANTPAITLGSTWTIDARIVAKSIDPSHSLIIIGSGTWYTANNIQITYYGSNAALYLYDSAEHGPYGPLQYDVPRHIRVTSDGGDPPRIRIFMDGILQGSYLGQSLNSATWYIGDNPGYSRSAKCDYDEILITQECLSTSNFTIPSAPYIR